MPKIQMQKAGAGAACQGDAALPASDLGFSHQSQTMHSKNPNPPIPTPKNSPLQPTTGGAAKAAGGFYA
jgi:hypothetical protein